MDWNWPNYYFTLAHNTFEGNYEKKLLRYVFLNNGQVCTAINLNPTEGAAYN